MLIFVRLIFVAAIDYENIFTTKISRFTVATELVSSPGSPVLRKGPGEETTTDLARLSNASTGERSTALSPDCTRSRVRRDENWMSGYFSVIRS